MTELWLFLHVLSSIIAFGVFFAAPLVARSAEGANLGLARAVTFVQAPALVALLFTGIMNAYAMEPREVFKETWIHIAFTLWILMAVVMFFIMRTQRSGSKSVQPLTGAMHLLLVVALWAMVWQPGAPG
jgi:carbohydrate-selective porin OprB